MPIIIGLLSLSLASSGAIQTDAPAIPTACVQFSEPFYLAAQVREGRTEEQALYLFQSARSKSPSNNELLAEKAMIAAIHLAYRHPHLPPDEIKRRVQLACSVSPDGKVQFNGL
jgi:hypothetical protein